MTEETHQRWLNSEELDFAWFDFASEYEKDQFRNAGTEHRMEALSIMMKAELIAKIHGEELYCYGLRAAPTLSDGPERIPSYLFVELRKMGPLLENIDWGKSTLRSAGREYVQVRVFRPQEMEHPDRVSEPGKNHTPANERIITIGPVHYWGASFASNRASRKSIASRQAIQIHANQ
jgi:hypothetical protein